MKPLGTDGTNFSLVNSLQSLDLSSRSNSTSNFSQYLSTANSSTNPVQSSSDLAVSSKSNQLIVDRTALLQHSSPPDKVRNNGSPPGTSQTVDPPPKTNGNSGEATKKEPNAQSNTPDLQKSKKLQPVTNLAVLAGLASAGTSTTGSATSTSALALAANLGLVQNPSGNPTQLPFQSSNLNSQSATLTAVASTAGQTQPNLSANALQVPSTAQPADQGIHLATNLTTGKTLPQSDVAIIVSIKSQNSTLIGKNSGLNLASGSNLQSNSFDSKSANLSTTGQVQTFSPSGGQTQSGFGQQSGGQQNSGQQSFGQAKGNLSIVQSSSSALEGSQANSKSTGSAINAATLSEVSPTTATTVAPAVATDANLALASMVALPSTGATVSSTTVDGTLSLDTTARVAVMKQVTDRIQLLAASKPQQEVTVHLQPADLGNVILNIKTIGKALEATLSASHDGVRQTLSDQKDDLTAAIQRQGFSVASVKVMETSSSSSAKQNPQSGQNQSGAGYTNSQTGSKENQKFQKSNGLEVSSQYQSKLNDSDQAAVVSISTSRSSKGGFEIAI